MLRVIFSFLTFVSFSFSFLGESQARTCELKPDGQSLTFQFKDDGKVSRPPTMKEVFDRMNVEGSSLFEDLKFDEAKQGQALVFLQNDSSSPRYAINWSSKPKAGVGDRACRDKKMNGYDCRVKQLKQRKTPELGTVPSGILTSVVIQVPSENKALVQQIGTGLGCDRLVFTDGKPFAEPAATTKGTRLVLPAGAGSTAP